MPQPIYIICSQSGVRDAQTGFFSYFHVVEKLVLRRVRIHEPTSRPIIIPSVPLRISAVWKRGEDESSNQEFEHETLLVLPNQQELRVGSGTFRFDGERQHIAVDVKHYMLPGPGTIRAINRIRNVGEQEWISQEYPILAVVDPSEPTELSGTLSVKSENGDDNPK